MSFLNRFSAAQKPQTKLLNEFKKDDQSIGQLLSSEEKIRILGGKRLTNDMPTGISVLPPQ